MLGLWNPSNQDQVAERYDISWDTLVIDHAKLRFRHVRPLNPLTSAVDSSLCWRMIIHVQGHSAVVYGPVIPPELTANNQPNNFELKHRRTSPFPEVSQDADVQVTLRLGRI